MTLSDIEWPFHGSSTVKSTSSASRAISAVAGFLVRLGWAVQRRQHGVAVQDVMNRLTLGP